MENKNSNLDKIFWGLFFIIGAVVLIFNKVGYLPLLHSVSVFSIVLTILFIWMIFNGLRHRNFFELMFGIAFISIIYDKPLGITALTPWTVLGAALLIAIGCTLIFGNHPHIHHHKYHNDAGSKVFNESDGEVINFENSFSSSAKYINTDALVAANLESSFGEMKVYFDNAVIKNGIAEINVEVSFGSMVLYIPKTWNVENHVISSFGAVDEKNSNDSPGCPTLKLYGEVSFGAVQIYYI